jgi:hypothetical protein
MTLRWSTMLVVAVGCDRALGLQETVLADGPPPPMCTTRGLPPFSNRLVQAVAHDCVDYTVAVDSGRALARCSDGGLPYIAEGPVDTTPSQVLNDFDDLVTVAAARIDPDGSAAIVIGTSASTGQLVYRRYRRRAIGSPWVYVVDLPAVVTTTALTSATRGPNAHVIAVDNVNVYELVENVASWTVARTTPLADLGITPADEPTITADGLRLLFARTLYTSGGVIATVYYLERASIDAPFVGPPTDVPSLVDYTSTSPTGTLLPTLTGYMTPDCGRFYFSALSSVFYVAQ